MRYIVTKRFRGEAICGRVNLPYGTVCEAEDGYLTAEGKRLCAVTSQNAYDHFSRDDDGQGRERGELVRDIRARLETRDRDYQRRWDRLWADRGANRLRRQDHEDFWVWGPDFYGADTAELRRIRNLIA